MNKHLSNIVSLLSVPILILNVLGGVIGGFWMLIEGQGALVFAGLLYIFFGSYIISLLLLPNMLLGMLAIKLSEKYKSLSLVATFFGTFYIYVLIIYSSMYIAYEMLNASQANVWATLIWMYAVILSPWRKMSTAESENSFTFITLFFHSAGILLTMILVGIFNYDIGMVFPIFLLLMLIVGIINFIAATFIIKDSHY